MRTVFAVFFLLTCILAAGSTGPRLAYAKNQSGGNEEDKNREKPRALYITKKVLDMSDIEKMDQAIKDGRKVFIDTLSLKQAWISAAFWRTFMPYEPKLVLELINVEKQTNYKKIKSLLRARNRLRQLLGNLENKLKAAKKFGTPKQVRIVENMVKSLNDVFLSNKEATIKRLRR